jgi:hypothetical protein
VDGQLRADLTDEQRLTLTALAAMVVEALELRLTARHVEQQEPATVTHALEAIKRSACLQSLLIEDLLESPKLLRLT